MISQAQLALSGAGVRVVVVGTASHVADSRLPDVPEVAGTVDAISRCLIRHCGLVEDRLRVLRDPEGPEQMLDAVMAAAEEADDVLLIYYVGHGVLSMTGELHLATRATRDLTLGKAAYQALPYAEIRTALIRTRAESVVVVLDCCFSGRAELPRGRSLVLTSASGEQNALVPPGAEYPAFTGELLELLATGDPDGPPQLTVDHVDRYLKSRLRERGRPVPHMQDRERARDLVLAGNAAYRPPPDWAPSDSGAVGQVEDICPYQGLAAYRVEDARFFHGRGRLVAELVRRVGDAAVDGGAVAVVGPSGSGKSSLLSAGLLPAVARGELGIPGSTGWTRMTITPGPDPLGALPASGDADRLVLVVDQFEELFTQCRSDPVRQRFVAALDAIARRETCLVVLGIRGDFYGHCVDYPKLKAVLEERQLLVGAMTTPELREAIEEPARITGRHFEPGLVELLLRDLGCDPSDPDSTGHDAGSLPLLSHVLREIWRRRRGRVLPVNAYRETGGIGRALANSADQELAGLDVPARDAMRRMLPRLVTVTDGAPDTLRRLPRDALLAGLPDPVAGERVLEVLAAARLITVDAGTVTITHEALITSWPTLRRWIDDDREWLRTAQQLTADAVAWEAANRESALLYRGAVLAGVMQRADVARRLGELPAVVSAFLAAAWQQERAAGRRRRIVVTVLATVTVLALAATALAVVAQRVASRERASAEAQRDLALARAVAAKAETFKRTDPRLARQLTSAAHRMASGDPQVSNTVLAAGDIPMVAKLGDRPPIPRNVFTPDGQALITGHDNGFDIRDAANLERLGEGTVAGDIPGYRVRVGRVTDLSLGHGGRLLAIASESGLGLWDVTDRRRPTAVFFRPAPDLQSKGLKGLSFDSVAIPPTGPLLAYYRSGAVELLDAADPRRPVSVGKVPRIDVVEGLAFSPDGKLLAVFDSGTIGLWDVSDPSHPVRRARLPGAVDDSGRSWTPVVRFGPRGLIAYSGVGNTSLLWSIANLRRPVRLAAIGGHSDVVTSIAMSGDGQLLVSGSEDTTVRVTHIGDPGSPVHLGTVDGHTSRVTGTAFSPRGAVLATASRDSTLRVWPFVDPRRRPALASITGADSAGVLAANGDRTLTATGGEAAAVTLWDSDDPARLVRLATIDVGGEAIDAAISPDGRLLVVIREASDPAVLLVDISDPRRPRRLPGVSGLPGYPSSVAISGDGRMVAIGTLVGRTPLYDVSSPAEPALLATIDGLGWVTGLSFDPTRPLLAAASLGRTTSLFDLSDPRHPDEVAKVEQHDEQVGDLAISPDGHWLATTDRNSITLLWDIRTLPDSGDSFKPVAKLQTPGDDFPRVDFSPDSRRLVTAVGERTVRVWDLTPPSGPVPRLDIAPGGGKEPDAVLVGPGGRTVLLAMSDPAVDVFAIDPGDMARRLCAGAGDPLTSDEWYRYLPGRPYEPPCS